MLCPPPAPGLPAPHPGGGSGTCLPLPTASGGFQPHGGAGGAGIYPGEEEEGGGDWRRRGVPRAVWAQMPPGSYFCGGLGCSWPEHMDTSGSVPREVPRALHCYCRDSFWARLGGHRGTHTELSPPVASPPGRVGSQQCPEHRVLLSPQLCPCFGPPVWTETGTYFNFTLLFS